MKIRLLDYQNTEHFVNIPNDTESITIEIRSGDMVMIEPYFYDTGVSRTINYDNDGIIKVDKKDFAKLNMITSSYQLHHLEDCELE